LHVHFFL
jgi:hypothetical protein